MEKILLQYYCCIRSCRATMLVVRLGVSSLPLPLEVSSRKTRKMKNNEKSNQIPILNSGTILNPGQTQREMNNPFLSNKKKQLIFCILMFKSSIHNFPYYSYLSIKDRYKYIYTSQCYMYVVASLFLSCFNIFIKLDVNFICKKLPGTSSSFRLSSARYFSSFPASISH